VEDVDSDGDLEGMASDGSGRNGGAVPGSAVDEAPCGREDQMEAVLGAVLACVQGVEEACNLVRGVAYGEAEEGACFPKTGACVPAEAVEAESVRWSEEVKNSHWLIEVGKPEEAETGSC